MMAKPISMKLSGVQDIKRKLKKLGDRTQRKVVRNATSAAATVIVKEARRLAPKRSGLLKKSIIRVVRTYKRSGIIWAGVGIDKNAQGTADGRKARPVNYAHLVEFGTSHSARKPFLRPALRKHVQAYNKFVMQAKKRMSIELARL